MMFLPAFLFVSLVSYSQGYYVPGEMRWVMVFVMAAFVLVAGAARLFRDRLVRIDALDFYLLAFTIYVGLSLMWTPDPRNGLVFLVSWLALWAIFTAVKNAGPGYRWMNLHLAVAFSAAAVLIIKTVWPRYWSINENFVAEFLLLTLPFIVGMIISGWRSRLPRWLGIGLVLWVLYYLLWQNDSKIEFLVLPVVIGAGCFIYLLRQSRKAAMLLMVVFVAMMAFPVWVYWSGADGYGGSLLPRLGLYYDTLMMWLHSPLLGNGAGSFAYLYPEFQELHLGFLTDFDLAVIGKEKVAGAAHNDYLQFLSDFGLIGAILILMAARVTWKALRPLHTMPAEAWVGVAGLAVVLTNAMIEFPLQNAPTALLTAISAGAVANAASLPIAKRYDANAIVLGIVLPVMLVAGSVLLFSAWRIDAAQREQLQALRYSRVDPQGSFAHIVEANRLNPFDWNMRVHLHGFLLQWNRSIGTSPLSPEKYDAVYATSRSAGPQPMLLIERLQYLLDTGRYQERSNEVVFTLAWLKQHFANNAEVWIADAYHELLTGRQSAAVLSIAKIKTLRLNPVQEQQLAGLQSMLEKAGPNAN